MATPGVEAIAAERQRQIDEEGYTFEHDLRHHVDDFVTTAAAYLGQGVRPGGRSSSPTATPATTSGGIS